HLKEAFPEHGFLSEESDDDPSRFEKDYVWIIDPLDGTKEFVNRNGEFAINIALTYKGEPVLGVVGAPTFHKVYYAIKGKGAFVRENGIDTKIHVSNRKMGELIPYCSRSFSCPDAIEFVKKNREMFACESLPLGSALKMAFIAEGKGDFFLRLYGGTKEWDVCAGDIIVKEAGGSIFDGTTLKSFVYNRKDVYNRNGYIIVNHAEFLRPDLIEEWKKEHHD
nr:3'(2'),5'-bisphosphate nucleotidase CysQ [Bacilli bacterium]